MVVEVFLHTFNCTTDLESLWKRGCANILGPLLSNNSQLVYHALSMKKGQEYYSPWEEIFVCCVQSPVIMVEFHKWKYSWFQI